MTTTSDHTGTTRYLAPELVMSEESVPPTLSSDVYALGSLGLEVRSLGRPNPRCYLTTEELVYLSSTSIFTPSKQPIRPSQDTPRPETRITSRYISSASDLAFLSYLANYLETLELGPCIPSFGTRHNTCHKAHSVHTSSERDSKSHRFRGCGLLRLLQYFRHGGVGGQDSVFA
jgi:serine/threonine protein kinase